MRVNAHGGAMRVHAIRGDATLKHIVETAFELYKSGHLKREELMRILWDCIDAVAMDNGYVERFGLPSRLR